MSRVIPLLTDRTSIETDWTCGMKYWWYKFHDGHGIVPVEEADYYLAGRQLHADYAALASGGDVGAIVRRIIGDALGNPEKNALTLEQAWWHAGMVAAFGLFILPKWLEHYKPLLIEKELVLHRGPLEVACTEDLCLAGLDGHPTQGEVIVIDYKSVRWLASSWVRHWPYAIQMQILPAAIEEALGVKVTKTIVVGVQKGQIRDGKARHPYTYAYVSEGGVWQAEYKYGWTLCGLWERPVDDPAEAVVEWVRSLGSGTALDLHPMSEPIFSNPRILDKLIIQRVRREEEIARVRVACQTDLNLRDIYFESRFDKCRPTIGGDCPYLAACHNAQVGEDPVGSGMYIPRTPHHDLEWLHREGA